MKRLVFSLLLFVSVSLSAAAAGPQPLVVIVRHAEKATEGGKDPDLSPEGQTRADALARILKDANIKSIFTTEFKRTQETADPTATAQAIAPVIVSARDTAGLVERLHHLKGNALVVGHGDSIPSLVKALGIEAPVNIPENDYTEIFIVTLGDKPQLVRLHYPN